MNFSRRMLLALGLLPYLWGCVAMPKKADDPAATQLSAEAKAKLKTFDYSGLGASDKNAFVTVSQSILPGDPNYFLRNPAWAEYVIEIRVLAPTLTLKDFRMIGANGTYINSASSFQELDKTPSVQGETIEILTVTGGAMAVGAGAMMTGSLALAPVAIFAAPVIIGAYFINKSGEADETVAYAKELSKRALSSGSTSDKDAVTSGSVFFPLIDKPRALVLDYTTTDSTLRQLRINLARSEPNLSPTVADEMPVQQENKAPVVKPSAKKKQNAENKSNASANNPKESPKKAGAADL
jgi:hypothetical protein